MIIAITGSIGSGKSTVSEYFKDLGYPVFDSDKMVHAYYEQGTSFYHALVTRYGKKVLDQQENIDRKQVASIVFSEPKELDALEALVFPQVRKDILELKEMHRDSLVFVEVPLLFEAKLEDLFDKVMMVDANKEIRYQRLHKKGYNEDAILAREKRQFDNQIKRDRADIVIENNEDLSRLFEQLEKYEKEELR